MSQITHHAGGQEDKKRKHVLNYSGKLDYMSTHLGLER